MELNASEGSSDYNDLWSPYKRFSNLNNRDEQFTALLADVGVAGLSSSENDYDIEDIENVDSNILPPTNMNQLKLLDIQLEPTPPCNLKKNYDEPPKVRRNSRKHKLEESTPTSCRKRPKQMKPRAILVTDYFAKISDELILQIFQLLPRYNLQQCALTCKRWRRIAYDECFWKTLNLGGKNVSPDVVNCMLGRGIVSLRLSKADLAITSSFNHLNLSLDSQSIGLIKLQNLDMSMASITSEGVETIIANCTELRNVSLENCEISTKVCQLLGNNEKLTQLNLALCTGITAVGLQALLTNCNKLEAVNMGWIDLDEKGIDAIAKCMPNSVTKLNLSGCRDVLADHHVQVLVSRCTHIEELDLSDSSKLTHIGLEAIVEKLDKLRLLALSRCFRISPQHYNLIGSLPCLSNLDLHGLFNVQGVDFLKWRYPNIRINQLLFSSIARPTTGFHRTSIWGHKVQE